MDQATQMISSGPQPADEKSQLLNGDRSVTGRLWTLRRSSARDVELMCQKLGVEPALAEILSSRNISPEDAGSYLAPSLKQHLPDPDILVDMKPAVSRIAHAIRTGEKIGVFGDYDVDGTTSAALLERYFTQLGVSHDIYLPDRFTEGYGPNLAAFRYLQEKGAQLCLTVDCGAMAHEILEQVREDGLDVVVLDHHQMTLPPPPVVATVNPNRPDDLSGLTNLSAAGVTFMMLVALNRYLRQDGYFEDKAEPNLLHWLDLVALGLVCDVMPLTGVTRVLVAQGLKVLGRFGEEETPPARYPGLFHLATRAGATGPAQAWHFGFTLGPRINAAGRIGHANLALELMTAGTTQDALEYVEKLHQLNAERQAIEKEVLDEAIQQIESGRQNKNPVLVMVASEKWHPGVIGIVAGRLKEKYHCPSIVISLEGGIGKGSGRSIEGVDLGGVIAAARRKGLLVSGGGHAMAAGLTVEELRLPDLEQFFKAELEENVETAQAAATFKLDGIVSPATVTRSFTDRIAAAGPFGTGNPEPRVMMKNVMIRHADIKGGQHIACTLADGAGNTARAISFRCVDEPIGEALLAAGTRKLHVAGRIKPDDWRGGNAAQFHIEDVAFA